LTSSTQAITGLGFTPTVIIFQGVKQGSAELSWGMSSDSTHGNRQSAIAKRGNSTTVYNIDLTNGGIVYDEDGANIYAGSVSSWDADGFTISWVKTASPTGTLSINYLAFK
jgi:hypothetical protein